MHSQIDAVLVSLLVVDRIPVKAGHGQYCGQCTYGIADIDVHWCRGGDDDEKTAEKLINSPVPLNDANSGSCAGIAQT